MIYADDLSSLLSPLVGAASSTFLYRHCFNSGTGDRSFHLVMRVFLCSEIRRFVIGIQEIGGPPARARCAICSGAPRRNRQRNAWHDSRKELLFCLESYIPAHLITWRHSKLAGCQGYALVEKFPLCVLWTKGHVLPYSLGLIERLCCRAFTRNFFQFKRNFVTCKCKSQHCILWKRIKPSMVMFKKVYNVSRN